MIELEKIKEMSIDGEKEIDSDGLLPTPQGDIETGKTFKRDDVLKCFDKAFGIRELVFLVGSTCTNPENEAHDVDVVIPMVDLPNDLQDAIKFRLYRAFAGYFDIPYDEVPKYLSIHFKEEGKSPYTDWSVLYMLGLIPTSEEERIIHQMSLTQNEILEKSNDFVIAGLVSTPSIDLQNEKITREALKRIWKHLQGLDESLRNVCWVHSSTQIGTVLMEYKNRRSALLDEGLFLICKLRQDIPVAKEIIKKIRDGELNSFSIKVGIPHPTSKYIREVCDKDKCWRELTNAYFIEVSLTDNPANLDCKDQIEILT